MSSEVPEKRKVPRSSRGFPIRLESHESGITNRVLNVSTSGILCGTVMQIETMSKVGMTLFLPEQDESNGDHHEIECEGVVVRSEEQSRLGADPVYHLAIFFTKISDEDRKRIARHVENDLGR